jgi:hypothetical protein
MSDLRSHLSDLTASLVAAIFAAARSAPLDELIADPRRPHEDLRGRAAAAKPERPIVAATEQAPLRSPGDDIAKTLGLVVLLLRGHKDGLRAEQLRKKLGVDKQQMPRILKQGLVTKKLTSTGQRRNTTYFAASGSAPARSAGAREAHRTGQQALRF